MAKYKRERRLFMASQTRRMDSSLNTGDLIDTRQNSFHKIIGEKEWMEKVYSKKLRDKRSSRWRR